MCTNTTHIPFIHIRAYTHTCTHHRINNCMSHQTGERESAVFSQRAYVFLCTWWLSQVWWVAVIPMATDKSSVHHRRFVGRGYLWSRRLRIRRQPLFDGTTCSRIQFKNFFSVTKYDVCIIPHTPYTTDVLHTLMFKFFIDISTDHTYNTRLQKHTHTTHP